MDHFAGLDVSVKETSLCIVDEGGRIVREVKVASEPEALLQVLTNPAYHFKRIGLEAGPLSQWLFNALAEVGLPVICVEAIRCTNATTVQINFQNLARDLSTDRELSDIIVRAIKGKEDLTHPEKLAAYAWFFGAG